MPKRESRLPAEELELFRQAVQDAVPLDSPPRVKVGQQGLSPPVPVQSLLDEHDALAEAQAGRLTPELALETGEEASFLREGLPTATLRKLRRGLWVIQDEIDLHGATRAEARELLAEFLRACLRRRLRCVRVVHGKGLGSVNREPVLKGKVRSWLARRDEVLAFCQAPGPMGGSGALLVLLKEGR